MWKYIRQHQDSRESPLRRGEHIAPARAIASYPLGVSYTPLGSVDLAPNPDTKIVDITES